MKQKPLPLIPDCDQITANKPLNREEHEERDRWIQAVISPSILHQILTSTLRGCGNERGRGWNQEKRERGCLDSSIGLKSQLGCLQTMKNKSFYTVFYLNRPIVSIDGYDETSTMDRF